MTTSALSRALRIACSIGLAVAAVGPGIVQAAEQVVLDEVIVTAERRSERAQDVPIAISAFSAADLEARGVRQAGDIAAGVPNLMLSSPYGEEAQPTFALRGVTTNDWSQNQSSPIAMYVDDVYKSVGAVQALQTYDLDRVEVLRGPQGTLYGKNATGGAMNFYSRNPSLTETDGYITAGFGNYNARTVTAAAGTPIIENELGVRAAVYYAQRDGWVRSVVPGVQPLNGVDALLSIVQMPPGVPVACAGIGSAGAVNAAVLAAQMLALSDPALQAKLKAYKEELERKTLEKDRKCQQEFV